MSVKIRQHKNREKGASLFVAVAGLVWVVIPMMGLFIDLGILYSVKARLQAAVDGAALAAARALNLGSTTADQATAAQQNAVNWFYANFPTGNWSTTNTIMSTANVTVVNSPSNANLRQVTVTAQTNVPAWFMRWVGFNFTTLTVQGQASRKDLVAMLVLDRSGSMCSINGGTPSPPCAAGDGTPCASMITAAKNFTGAFAEGRDQIGMLTFSDGWYLDSRPTTNFQSLLGYSNASGSSAGAIDNITCAGGTGTAGAMSIAYNELYKIAEPGAMNLIMLETDGLPNTLVYNFYATPGTTKTLALNTSSGCQDANGKTWNQGGWTSSTTARQWLPTNGSVTAGIAMNTNGTGFMSDIPNSTIGAFYTADPSQGPPYYNDVLFDPRQISDTQGSDNSIALGTSNVTTSNGATAGCQFPVLSRGVYSPNSSSYSDFNWLPSQDVFGNQIAPSNEYQNLSLTNSNGVSYLNLTGTISTDWPNTHAAALNATDNSAYNIRSNGTLPAYVFTIGLGGNHGNPPDPILLQRMANDPNGDQFNNPAVYPACNTEPSCISYASQPQGVFIYAPTAAQLGQAFLAISSQILRLSH
jgi:Flp pilus assembly protein TadG